MILITIDGPSGSLKTTWANQLEKEGIRVLHADDFFYPVGLKKHKLSGNFNAYYFIKNVLPKALKENEFSYLAFNCKNQKYYKKYAPSATITLLEGSYSSTKLLDKYRDLSIYIKTDKNSKKRVKRRVGNKAYKNFEDRWFIDEKKFTKKFKTYNQAIMVSSYRELIEILKNLKTKQNSM